jgi:cytochrome bd ubiquinol oxidase subunit II
VAWTAFGSAFASIMTTMFIPLGLAALGIVLRAGNFVLRKEAAREGRRHLTGRWFGLASLLTPFFIGAALGGVITARVPEGNAAGNQVTSWLNVTSILIGCLAVMAGAFLAATYLTHEARRREQPDMVEYFCRRAVVAGVALVGFGIAAFFALRADERQMYDRFVDRSWWLLALATVGVAVVVAQLLRGAIRGARVIAAAGIAALVAAWGVAQYPYLLPFDLTIDAGAGSATTSRWVLVWFVVALVTVVPSLVFLFVLEQRGEMVESAAPREITYAGDDPTRSTVH